MEAAEQEVKGLGGDEDDGELKQKAGQSEVEEACGFIEAPDAGRVQRRIYIAEIGGDVSGPLRSGHGCPTHLPVSVRLLKNGEEGGGGGLCFACVFPIFSCKFGILMDFC